MIYQFVGLEYGMSAPLKLRNDAANPLYKLCSIPYSHSTWMSVCGNVWYSIYLSLRDRRLSWPRWLVTHRDGLPASRQSPIQVVTGPSVEQLRWSRPILICPFLLWTTKRRSRLKLILGLLYYTLLNLKYRRGLLVVYGVLIPEIAKQTVYRMRA